MLQSAQCTHCVCYVTRYGHSTSQQDGMHCSACWAIAWPCLLVPHLSQQSLWNKQRAGRERQATQVKTYKSTAGSYNATATAQSCILRDRASKTGPAKHTSMIKALSCAQAYGSILRSCCIPHNNCMSQRVQCQQLFKKSLASLARIWPLHCHTWARLPTHVWVKLTHMLISWARTPPDT